MLALMFYLGETMYVIKHEKVREVSPVVALKKVPHAPDYFAGFFNYRGRLVPVFDLCQVIQGAACRMRLSTRIILVDYHPSDQHAGARIFGLMAERVTEAVRKTEEDFITPDFHLEIAPYLEEFMTEGDDMIQCIDLEKLIEKYRFLPLLEQHAGEMTDVREHVDLDG